MSLLLNDHLQFAYSQFSINDVSQPAGLLWEQAHVDQGFARLQSNVAFATLADFGTAPLRVFLGPLQVDLPYDLAIAVPFQVVTGSVAIEGPEEVVIINRQVQLEPGPYRLIGAQVITKQGDLYAENEIAIDVYFERLVQPLARSALLVIYPSLHPPPILVETANEPYP